MAYSPYRTQNDVIPFYILAVRIARERGDLNNAEILLKQIIEHEYIRSGECTLVAQVDLEIERLEIRCAKNEIEASDLERISNLIRKLEAEHHLLMAAECRVIYAKLLTGTARSDALRMAAEKFADQGVHLWDKEIARAYRK